MDSEHRHELEENDLDKWLRKQIDATKEHLPLVIACVALAIGGPVAYRVWNDAKASEQADRWHDYTVAVEGIRPNLALLNEAAEAHPDTDVADWARITWADGKLWEATRLYLANRDRAEEALAEANVAYNELLRSSHSEIAQRAAYGLARGAELVGDLEKAREGYSRVTGALAEISAQRAEELDSERLKGDYAWLSNARVESASATLDPSARPGAEPDDIALPEETSPEDAETAMEDILGGLESEAAEVDVDQAEPPLGKVIEQAKDDAPAEESAAPSDDTEE